MRVYKLFAILGIFISLIGTIILIIPNLSETRNIQDDYITSANRETGDYTQIKHTREQKISILAFALLVFGFILQFFGLEQNEFMFQKIKKEYKKYSKKDLWLPVKILDFLWRKKYKTLLAIFFYLGTLGILFSEKVAIWLKIGNINIGAYEKISGSIVFFTAIVIFWYTRETADLKMNSTKELKELRRQNKALYTPYMRIQWAGSDGIIQVVNNGKGLAINIISDEIFLNDKDLISRFKIKNIPLLSPDGGYTTIDHRHITATEFIDSRKNELDLQNPTWVKRYLQDKAKTQFQIRLSYKNLESRDFEAIFAADDSYNDGFRIVSQQEIK